MSLYDTEDSKEMQVQKRDGSYQNISFDKILNRVKNLGRQANISKIPYTQLVMKVIDQLYDKINTTKIDELTAQQCASLTTTHPDYEILAGYIVISNHQKNTSDNFYDVMTELRNFKDVHGESKPIVNEEFYNTIVDNKDEFNNMINYERDFLIDYFGFKTLERAYLMRVNKQIVERPQHMWLRVAIQIHGDDIEKVKETYNLMSLKYFTHATPTLFNSGTLRPQLSSCYLLSMEDDSIDGIYSTLKDCAKISKWAGGIGLHIHNVRAAGSHIRGTNGTSNGIVPMLKVFNNTARYVDQGGGKRNGSFAIYLEPWHSDISEFLELRKNHGDEEMRARDLFYALWIPDLFMKRVKNNEDWTLMCPDECPGLSDAVGDDFEKLYVSYEKESRGKKTVKARNLWFEILDSQIETGTPYILFKDACNRKSNQKNLGTIKSSNLCTEIIEYSDEKETAVCNLASIALTMFVKPDKTFDYEKLHSVTKVVTTNLNNIIDINFYPTEKTKRSNLMHRPIGIGVQGLADAFVKMNVAFVSEEASRINKNIFETIYHASLERSNELAKSRELFMENVCKEYHEGNIIVSPPYNPHTPILDHMGSKSTINVNVNDIIKKYKPTEEEIKKTKCYGSYSSFDGSPASEGILQFDMWGVEPSDRYDWDTLKKNIVNHGLRNSLLVAPMPTASTSQILGNNECFEPFTSNIYSRRTIAGDFIVVNRYMIRELVDLGLWNEEMKNSIIQNGGSIQHLLEIPEEVRNKYKIVWEMPMKHVINMARDRGAYICQSQSLNLWIEDPNYKTLTAMHFYSWEQGLKTGLYYLRRKPKANAQQFTIEPEKRERKNSEGVGEGEQEEEEVCDMCSS